MVDRQMGSMGDRTSSARAKRKLSESAQTESAPKKRARLASDLSISASDDARALEAVESKFDVQIYSVISSHKIQKRVASVLRHLAPPSADDAAAKPRICVLRAKGPDAGKLISIAEIAKREIAKGEDGKGSWFQYIALGEEIKERWREPEEKTIIENTVLGGSRSDGEDGEDDENAFEIMKTPFERAVEGRPKLRAVPIMSLFLSTVPVDELKKRFGEQTNDRPNKHKS